MSYFDKRIGNQSSKLSKDLLQLVERKQSNLCVSVDFNTKDSLLKMVEAVGPYTHVDIISDFDIDIVEKLKELSVKYDFLIFEDRKFADIGELIRHSGNTVSLQYSSGVHKIADWSHITNAHALPGDGIVKGLKKVGLEKGRGLLLLAQMSSEGSLAVGDYTKASLAMAQRHKDFVIGFIAQEKLGGENDDFLILTPGVGLDVKGDGMGQQYRTPEEVIKAGTDVIIVGRGVTGSQSTVDYQKAAAEAQRYKKAGWEALTKVHGL
ncbi:hypothetical protein E3Q24_02884 [Wallemia mellicola]|uniref:Orotidine 5'-phosphate decarboxylase n=1 Tax=Wallemia mellicola TaxID=1708541 RepID=A0AB74KCS2_9BASI|nr:hypothetical protein E3Q24_02884 [Wallemia mellicola]TIC60992.1 Orotidine 5'-phosphate decarboxylase [Wallemia mellicola]